MFNADSVQRLHLSQKYRSGVHWFYWIAGLTLVTSVISLAGGGWRFFLSLGITQLVDAIAVELSASLGNATKVIAIVLDIFAIAVFAVSGWLASKRHLWAYVVGMVLFLLDGVVSLVFGDWLGVIVHAIVLVVMFRAFQSGLELAALERAQVSQPQETTVTASV
ncbi:MAG TPA: hypothetical protein VFD63_08625 [Pyrinomonadaceae bacterium]|jgi:hypothetical protein|nr:hypothetical protein [Pyrinomonadaceae bacterium]